MEDLINLLDEGESEEVELPSESFTFFKSILGEEYKNLSEPEVLALVTAEQETQITNSRLQVILSKHQSN